MEQTAAGDAGREKQLIRLARGRTAEVYAWDAGQVLKLFPPGYPTEEIEREARIAGIVAAAGVGAPAAGGVIALAGRSGILYARVEGKTMLEQLSQRPWTFGSLARTFGHLHAAMHERQRPELPAQRPSLLHAIEAAPNLPSAVRAAVIARLHSLPDGDAICHGDYHPDNILITPAGPAIIDWLTASHGNPDADVARTVLMLREGEVLHVNAVQRALITLLRRAFLHRYLGSYRRNRPCPAAAVAAWMPVIAAARLREGVPGEAPRLLTLAEQAM